MLNEEEQEKVLPTIQLYYLMLIPKAVAQNREELKKVWNKRREIPLECYEDLFYINKNELDRHTINKRQYIFTSETNSLGEYTKIIFDQYSILRNITMKHTSHFYDRDSTWEIFNFWDIKKIINKLNGLRNYKLRLNSGEYYLIYNKLKKEVCTGFWYRYRKGKEGLDWDPHVNLLSNPKLLLPEIKILYVSGLLWYCSPDPERIFPNRYILQK